MKERRASLEHKQDKATKEGQESPVITYESVADILKKSIEEL